MIDSKHVTRHKKSALDQTPSAFLKEKPPFEPIKTNGSHENGTSRNGGKPKQLDLYDDLYDTNPWRDLCR
ncbi:MAG: hypothetical protein QF909_17190 [SAR202 cluster bacterium]|jgi:hypothetical protein|nr:hypothetical protein [SAR202 cluster bacterium]|tara:strand:+ start:5406 stop:5615 length:210 start_codon:yes stop_codon:yes gene_type:complete